MIKRLFGSRSHFLIKTKPVLPGRVGDMRLTHRQELLPGFNQDALRCAHGLLVGAGGINSEVGEGLARKGVGRLTILDADCFELTNLNRQLAFERDIGKSKGPQLAHNLAPHALCGTFLEGHSLSFQDAVALRMDLGCSFVVCGVDNTESRLAVSRYFYARGIPVIFIAVDLHAQQGYVFVQVPEEACFGCVFPHANPKEKAPCRSGASKDILKVVAGIALYAIDGLLMDRKRNWNFRQTQLAGFEPDLQLTIPRRPNCSLCHE